MASTILNNTTKLSKRLNKDTKQPWKPKLYILRNISNVNSTTKNKLATSEKEKKKKELVIYRIKTVLNSDIHNITKICFMSYLISRQWFQLFHVVLQLKAKHKYQEYNNNLSILYIFSLYILKCLNFQVVETTGLYFQ